MKRPSSTLMTALVASVSTAITVVAATFATGLTASATGPRNTRPNPGAQELGDPDYGVCRGTSARCYHDWGNFDPAKGYKVLLYTRTAGPRHADLGPALGAGLNPALSPANVVQNGIVKLGRDNGFGV